MPDLKKAYIYEDWILDLALADRYKEFTRFDLFHQCVHGTICKTKGVLKLTATSDTFRHEDWTVQCNRCEAVMNDTQLQVMMAMWKLVVMTHSEG